MKIKLKDNTIIKPTQGYCTDAGYDMYSPVEMLMGPRSVSPRIDLGVGFDVPAGYMGMITERSSQGKLGVHTAGNIVDHGYTGNVHVTLVNGGNEPYKVNKGDRICQFILIKIGQEELEVVDSFEATERGEKSHGSTGV